MREQQRQGNPVPWRTGELSRAFRPLGCSCLSFLKPKIEVSTSEITLGMRQMRSRVAGLGVTMGAMSPEEQKEHKGILLDTSDHLDSDPEYQN